MDLGKSLDEWTGLIVWLEMYFIPLQFPQWSHICSFLLQWSEPIHQKTIWGLQENVSINKSNSQLTGWELGENVFLCNVCVRFCSSEPPTLWGPLQRTRMVSLAQRSRRNGETLRDTPSSLNSHALKRDHISNIMIHFCRKEAASSILKKSAVKQRSYVLSAAKKFE